MTKPERKQIAKHLKDYVALLRMSTLARNLAGLNSGDVEQIEKYSQRLEQWEPQKDQSL